MSEGETAGSEAGFFALLAQLRDFRAEELSGDPSDRALARAAGVSPTTIGNWLGGTQFPQDLGKVLTVVDIVAARAAARGITLAGLPDEKRWRAAHRDEAQRRASTVSAGVQRTQAIVTLTGPAAGRPLAEVTDAFALEVHRPMQPDEPQPGMPVLPPYVPREHDRELGWVVQAAADGNSRIAVLVGGSSTGKTRACWEVLQLLRDRPEKWRLWHPIDPSRPEAALRDLSVIGPRTVVWLNEAQCYLDVVDSGLGERVAAGLRELLRDPARAPVLLLATLWPQFWDDLTARPAGGTDLHAQARELLVGQDITLPAAFTKAQLQQLSRAGDARLTQAAAQASDGQVIQFLAGAPELLARYRNAPPTAMALIHVAMDGRRLGMRPALPHAFLEAAAPGYLTDDEWDDLDEGWLEQALAYTAVRAKGIRGPLTRIQPRPARSRTARRRSFDDGGQRADVPAGPLYRLADYLDQYGRRHRNERIPPPEFWAAAADHASASEQATLGDAAHARGLYRDAAQLHKNAAANGNLHAVLYLSHTMQRLHVDARPMHWAVTHVSLDNLVAVAGLFNRLREAGAQDQVIALASRAAAHAALDDPGAVARLLDSLREAGAQDQVAALLHRNPAGHAAFDDPGAVAGLLDSLRRAGAQEQISVLVHRNLAAHVPLDDPYRVARLLNSLREAGAQDQVIALASRAAAHAAFDDPGAVAGLLDLLREAGAQGQVIALADRAAAHAAFDDPGAVAGLLDLLREAGAQGQVIALADRAAAHVPLDNPGAVAGLLDLLREAGAQDQVIALADRAAAHVPLDNPGAVARLLNHLREAGMQGQVIAL